MKLPRIIFTKWYNWSDRNSIENADSPGVYILAKFKTKPSGRAKVLTKNIVYVGETCNNSLKGRWYQFNRSAFQSKDGHSGGWSYNDFYKKDDGANLYVAALPVPNLSEKLRHLFIRWVERGVILDYALKHGNQPVLNHK